MDEDDPHIYVPASELVQEILHLSGEPFSIEDFPYLHDIYDTDADELCLFTGRQVAKSTYLASRLVANAFTQPNGRQVLVSPLQEQAYVFSMQRLKDFTEDSPIVKEAIFSGGGVVNQVLRKVFSNNHMITLGYAQRTADRLRGQSIKDGATLGFDEIQDILPEVIPVVKELGFRAKDVTYMYCGTPKTKSNHMEGMRSRSTGNEWAVKCHHIGCGFWNYQWDERNIGDEGVVCARCRQEINTNTGQWISARKRDLHRGKDASITSESFRIPQLIVKPIMDDPKKYRELLNKLKAYPTEKFYNEVLGLPYDSAAQPITREQLERLCQSDRPNRIPRREESGIPPLVMGVDWATPVGENSYTSVVIGGFSSDMQRFHVYFWKVFKGHESDPIHQIQWIVSVAKEFNIRLIGADFGVGSVQNISICNALGEEALVQLWHTGMTGRGGQGARAKWDPIGRKYHLARTRVLTDTFEACRREMITLPRAEECDEFFDHMLADAIEYMENTHGIRYVNIDPDDCLHSLTFAMLAGELLLNGNFSGHSGEGGAPGRGANPVTHSDMATMDMEGHLGDEYYVGVGA